MAAIFRGLASCVVSRLGKGCDLVFSFLVLSSQHRQRFTLFSRVRVENAKAASHIQRATVTSMKRPLIFPVIFVFGCMALAKQGLDNLPTNDLITGSGVQTPEPMPPATQNTTPDPKPETQTDSQAAAAPDAAATDSAVHTVTGAINKDGDSYVLKVSDTTSYKLDDQAKAKPFQGQKVRVTGQVDLNHNQIHVQKIEPLL